MNTSDTTTDQAPVQEGRYGEHSAQVERFLAALPSVKGDRGYGDHRDEYAAEALWRYANFLIDDYNAEYTAALDDLEDEGVPAYSTRAVAAIILQDDLSVAQRELLYKPYENAIPWDTLSGKPAPDPNAEPKYGYVYPPVVLETLAKLEEWFEILAKNLSEPNDPENRSAWCLRNLAIPVLRQEAKRPIALQGVIKFERLP